jgi:hypothetical protein
MEMTFVKRHVSLDFYPAYTFVLRIYEQVVPYIPVALAVNQESRHETLKHYSFIFFEEEIDISMFKDCDRDHIGPGWVNPSLDTIVFSGPPAEIMKDAYDDWFDHIARCIYMGDFRQLEVRNLRWVDVIDGQLSRLFEHIMRFRGLRTVVLIGHSVAGPTSDQLEIIRKRAVDYLEEDKYMFDGCIVPVVKARQCTDLEMGEDASE